MNEGARILVVGLGNEIAQSISSSQWLQLSPFGDFPHARGMQRVDRAAADAMARELKLRSLADPNFKGLPFFIGHPDMPEVAWQFADKNSYAWVTELESRADGLYGRVEWTAPGRELIANRRFKAFSPHWLADQVTEGGRRYLRPVEIKSFGLTNNPNLPVRPLSNENNTQNLNSMNAKDIFNQIVTNLQTARQCTYEEAYELARLTNRELYAAMTAEGQTIQQKAKAAEKAVFQAQAPAREDRAAKVKDFVKAKMDAGLDYDQAWRLAQSELPEVFAAMQEPRR